MRIDKQSFVMYFEVAKLFIEEQEELCEALHKFLLDGHSVVTFGGSLLNSYIKLLAQYSGISIEAIEWLLFEGGGACSRDGGPDHLVITAEDLWEFEKEIVK